MKPTNDLDYVEFYAKQLKNDNRFFKQQKSIIESQIKASSSLFRNIPGRDFKKEARKYLRSVGLL